MFEEYKIKKILKSAGKESENARFLELLKTKLEKHIDENAIDYEFEPDKKYAFALFSGIFSKNTRWMRFKDLENKMKFAKSVAISMLFIFMMSGGAALASQDSVPGDWLYSVKILTEDIRYRVAYDSESKAKLHASFAAKRVAEINKVISRNGVQSEKVDEAIARLKHNADLAGEALKKNESENDGSELAMDVFESLSEQRKILKETFKKENEKLESREKTVKEKMRESEKGGGEEAISFKKELEGIENEKKEMEEKKDEAFSAIAGGKEEIKNHLNEEEKKAKDAEELKEDIQELVGEKTAAMRALASENSIPGKPFELFDESIKRAEAALEDGNISDSKIYIKNAEIELERGIEDMNEFRFESDNEENNTSQDGDLEKEDGEDDGEIPSGT